MPTLTELRTWSRERADMENSQFISDSELTEYINMAYSELYDILVTRYEDYFSEVVPFTLSSSNEYTIPSNFYKLVGLDYSQGGDKWIVVRKWNFEERNQVSEDTSSVNGDYRAWIVPRITKLVNGSDATVDLINYEEYIVVKTAMMMKDKEESDVSVLAQNLLMLKQRIEGAATNRALEPDRISDIYNTYNYYRSWNDRKYRIMGNKLIVLPIARYNQWGSYFTGF